MSSPQLTYYDMGAGVLAFSTMRQGGCSTGNYADFNINNYCGDAPEHIARNRQALAALIGVSEQHIVMPHQTHGTVVCRVDAPPAEVLEGVILLYDAEHHAACAVHAGWRGTVQRIVQEAVKQMQTAYCSQPCQLKAVIGPGISLESFEVGDEVYQQFADAGFDMAPIARRYAKWHLDLPQCNRIQLEAVGVRDVWMSDICTYQQYEQYFSARRLGINSGRIYTAIVLK